MEEVDRKICLKKINKEQKNRTYEKNYRRTKKQAWKIFPFLLFIYLFIYFSDGIKWNKKLRLLVMIVLIKMAFIKIKGQLISMKYILEKQYYLAIIHMVIKIHLSILLDM